MKIKVQSGRKSACWIDYTLNDDMFCAIYKKYGKLSARGARVN